MVPMIQINKYFAMKWNRIFWLLSVLCIIMVFLNYIRVDDHKWYMHSKIAVCQVVNHNAVYIGCQRNCACNVTNPCEFNIVVAYQDKLTKYLNYVPIFTTTESTNFTESFKTLQFMYPINSSIICYYNKENPSQMKIEQIKPITLIMSEHLFGFYVIFMMITLVNNFEKLSGCSLQNN